MQNIREKVAFAVDAALQKYKDSIFPIYGVRKGGIPDHIGSAFIIQISQQKFLITAAHVIDHKVDTELFILGNNDFVHIHGDFISTTAPDGDRLKDFYDFAISRIPEDVFSILGAVGFIDESDILDKQVDHVGRTYLAVGFPRSKNRRVNLITKIIKPKRARYYEVWNEAKNLYSKLGLDGCDHIAIKHRRRSFFDNGAEENSFEPKGLSGGPLFDLGNFFNPEFHKLTVTNKPYLAGILIEKHINYHVILSVKIELVLKTIRKYIDDASLEMPSIRVFTDPNQDI